MLREITRAAIVLALLTPLECADSGQAADLSFLVIRADQLRASALGCYGDAVALTPNIDALAAEGVRYVKAYSIPVCSAHRTSFDVGKLTHACPNLNKLHPVDRTTYDMLHDAGWRTAEIGKWHKTPVSLQLSNKEVVPTAILGGLDYQAGHEQKHELVLSQYYANGSSSPLPAGQWRPQKYVDLAKAQLDYAAISGQPFYLMLNLEQPHTPYADVEGTQWDVFDSGDVPVPGNVPAGAQTQASADLASYYSMVHSLDDAVGQVLDHLESLGLDDETIVIFTSDHGAHVGAHGLLAVNQQKRTPYEEATRVPLIIREPGAEPAVSDALFGTVDFKVLILDRAGIEAPPSLHGFKHVPGSLYVQHYLADETLDGPWRMVVRDDGVKYAVSEGSPSGWLMFDTEADPLELTNLIGTSDPREAEMLALLQESAALVGDTLP